MNTQEITKHLKKRKSALEFQTKLHSGLVSHNYIVEVGAFTVCKVNGKAVLKPINGKELPSQWDSAGVNEIKNKCNWTNMLGEKMEIKAIPYKDWYYNEIQSINNTLNMLEPLL